MKIEALRRTNRLFDLSVLGKDGALGVIEDALVGLDHWVLRYLVMRTEVSGRRVLLSPLLLGGLESATGRLEVALFSEEVEAIPPADPVKPVTRRQELEYNRYFCIPDYWVDGNLWGAEETAAKLASRLRRQQLRRQQREPGGPAAGSEKARSTAVDAPKHDALKYGASRPETGGGPSRRGEESLLLRASALYEFEARCGDRGVGTVQDLMFEAETLSIRYLVLELDRGLLRRGKKILLPLLWVSEIRRQEKQLPLRLPAQALLDAPDYSPGEPITRAYEKNLILHYNSLEYKL
jgi:hypothetical protein